MDGDNEKEVRAAVRRALQVTNFSSFLPYEFTQMVQNGVPLSINHLILNAGHDRASCKVHYISRFL